MLPSDSSLPTGCATEDELVGAGGSGSGDRNSISNIRRQQQLDFTNSHTSTSGQEANGLSVTEGHDTESGTLLARTRESVVHPMLIGGGSTSVGNDMAENDALALRILESVGHRARITAHLIRDIVLDGLKHEVR
jgi:hypothetical protein